MATNPCYVMAIDQGTFSSRVILFDDRGHQIDAVQKTIRLNRINDREVEQDGKEILESVEYCVSQILEKHRHKIPQIKTAGLSTQRSSILAWQPSDGSAISPVLSWQDTRAASWLDQFNSSADHIQSITGLRLNPHYGASKINWLCDQNKTVMQAIKNDDCVITPLASYLLYQLCEIQQIQIDSVNASRTLLMNLKQQQWDEELLELLNIKRKILPGIKPVLSNYGTVKNTGINIKAVNGDQNAAQYSDGEPGVNNLRINLGTGAFVLTPVNEKNIKTDKLKQSGLLLGLLNSQNKDQKLYIEGTVNGCAAALEWLKKQYKKEEFEKALNQIDYTQEHEMLFLNSIGGIGSPIWRQDIKPYFTNDNNASLQIKIQAVLESIGFLLMINIESIRSIKPREQQINIGGGLSNNIYLCQTLADLSQTKVIKSKDSESTARGIAWMALDNKNHWKKTAMDKSYIPQPAVGLEKRFNKFKQLITEL